MSNEELTRKALSIVAGRRQRAVTFAGQRAAEAAAPVPALEDWDARHAAAGAAAARLAATGAAPDDVQAALARVKSLEAQREQLLRAAGIDPASLLPAYTCPRCRDTGRVDGRLCGCVRQLVQEMRQREVNESSPLSLCSFDSFDLAKYPDTPVPGLGVSARAQMESVYFYCRDYARNFSLENPSLYLHGYAGLGKTHLALSIAREVLEKGYNVVYVSSQNAFNAIEKERFGAEGHTMDTLQAADLLILDDLGTEYISPYVSSCLYSLVNTRVCRRLPTIYTTNFINDADLQRRYTEKVVSRLLGSCEKLFFCGDDIRLQAK